jgi:hypothetical protein
MRNSETKDFTVQENGTSGLHCEGLICPSTAQGCSENYLSHEKQTMKEPFMIERLQKETKQHDLVLKKYERPMNHTHLVSPSCLKIGYI